MVTQGLQPWREKSIDAGFVSISHSVRELQRLLTSLKKTQAWYVIVMPPTKSKVSASDADSCRGELRDTVGRVGLASGANFLIAYK